MSATHGMGSLLDAFPSALAIPAQETMKAHGLSPETGDYRGLFVSIRGETILLPDRAQPLLAIHLGRATLGPLERQLADCLLSRGHDGFTRQAALRRILPLNEAWSIPFVIALAGDYVVEIVKDIHDGMPQFDTAIVAGFLAENPDFYRITCDRILSYWDLYYRRAFAAGDYPGFKLLRELDAIHPLAQDVRPRFLKRL